MGGLSHDLVSHMPAVAMALFGEPNKRLSKPNDLRYGNNGSLAIDPEKGTYFDHETNQGGGVLDLIKRETGKDGRGAYDWIKEHIDGGTGGGGPRRQIVAEYSYESADGDMLFQVVRMSPKDFRQRRPSNQKPGEWDWSVKGVPQVPYRLPELIEAIANDRTIFIVEGEKDVDRLSKLGVVATCNAGGAGKWAPSITAYFAGATVVILADNDDPGRAHADKVFSAISGTAASVKILDLPGLPHKGDVSDWLDAGGTVEKLNALVEMPAPPAPPPAGFVCFDDIEISTDAEWLVKGVLPGVGLSVAYG